MVIFHCYVSSPEGNNFESLFYYSYLVGGFISLKNMSLSVGMITFPIYGKSYKIPWFQTTNQLWIESFPHSLPAPVKHSGKARGTRGCAFAADGFPRSWWLQRLIRPGARNDGHSEGRFETYDVWLVRLFCHGSVERTWHLWGESESESDTPEISCQHGKRVGLFEGTLGSSLACCWA